MGTLLGKKIVERVEYILSDADNVRWSEVELLDWLNSAQRAIVALKPNSNMVTANVAMVAGTKQTINAAHHQLFSVVRNMGTGGSTPGPGIRQVERRLLDTCFPDWHLAAYADNTVQSFFFDEKDPKVFYVFPPQPTATTQQVECKVGAPPTELANLNAAITLDDVYENALVDYILYRAFAKDDDSPANRARSQAHYASFAREMGTRTALDTAYSADKEGLTPAPGAPA